MIHIRPFQGLRPQPQFARALATPPYDVLNSGEARDMARDNPYSFLHVTKPEIDLDPSVDHYHESVYATGARNLKSLISRGILFQDQEPCFYVYRLDMNGYVQTGLAAAISCKDYSEDRIKKHEKTREDKENDRLRHILCLRAQTGPVLLIAPDAERFKASLAQAASGQPVYDFTAADNIRHTLWVVDDVEGVGDFIAAMIRTQAIYVADGHHRSAAASRAAQQLAVSGGRHSGMEPYNFFLGVIFPEDELRIMEYNRAVKDLRGLSPGEFLTQVSERFEIGEAPQPSPPDPATLGIYLHGRWHWAAAKAGLYNDRDPVDRLSVSILQDHLLAPVLGIQDPRRDKRIDFIGGIRGTAELERVVDSGAFAVAFSLYPALVEDLMAIANAGRIMPPKSTWFEPKLRDGLVTHLLD